VSWDSDKAQAFLAWLGTQPMQPCPICASQDWMVDTELGSLPGSTPGGGLNLSRGFSVILISCQKCGFVRHFMARDWLKDS